MPNNDPAVTQAAEMWNQGQRREAMRVLVNRVEQLVEHIENTPVSHSSSALRGFIFGALVVLIIGMAILLVPGYIDPAADHDPAVQEWWSYNAGTVDEFLSSLRLATMMTASGIEGSDSLFYDYMIETGEFRDAFEAAEYPYKAKEIRDNILSGMLDYRLFMFGVDEDAPTGELSEETLQYAKDGDEHMRIAVEEIKKLTGEDASFLVLSNGE